ncbi:MAG: hypothetical protein ACOYEV_07275 [Candidatus Nanopelagicales bacterium]
MFAGDTDAYLRGLAAFRDQPQRLDDWIIGFCRAAQIAAGNAVNLASDIDTLQGSVRQHLVEHRTRLGLIPKEPRRGAVVLRILENLAAEPVITVESAANRHGVTPPAAHAALVGLAAAGILTRNRLPGTRTLCWTADRHLGLVALTERSNRVGGADTRTGRPRLEPPAPDRQHVGLPHAPGQADASRPTDWLQTSDSLGRVGCHRDRTGRAEPGPPCVASHVSPRG